MFDIFRNLLCQYFRRRLLFALNRIWNVVRITEKYLFKKNVVVSQDDTDETVLLQPILDYLLERTERGRVEDPRS